MLFGVVSSLPMLAPVAVLAVALAVLVLAALSLAKWKLPKLLAFCGLSAAVAAGSYFALELRKPLPLGPMPVSDVQAVPVSLPSRCNCEPCNCEVEIIPAAISVAPEIDGRNEVRPNQPPPRIRDNKTAPVSNRTKALYWEIAEEFADRIDSHKLQHAIIVAVEKHEHPEAFRKRLEAMLPCKCKDVEVCKEALANVRVCGCR